MKFIVFSDLHLHNWSYGSSIREDGWNSRLLFQFDALNQIKEYAIANDIHHVFFTGDMFHTHQSVNAGPLAIAMRAFSDWRSSGLQTVFLVGNHDFANAAGTIHSLEALRPYGIVVDRPMRLQSPGFPLPIHAAPFIKQRDDLVKFLSDVEENSLVLMHQGVSGISVNSTGFTLNEILQPEDIPENIFHAFTGHYHSHKCVSYRLTIPGSPLQHTWSDVGEDRGFVVSDTDTGVIQHVKIVAPEFVKVEEASLKDKNIDYNLKYVKVSNYTKNKVEKCREKLLAAGALSVEFEKRIKKESVEVKHEVKDFDLPSVFKEFCKQNDLSADLIKVGQNLIDGNS